MHRRLSQSAVRDSVGTSTYMFLLRHWRERMLCHKYIRCLHASILSGCGGGGKGTNAQSTTSQGEVSQGRVFDGYISGARVFRI